MLKGEPRFAFVAFAGYVCSVPCMSPAAVVRAVRRTHTASRPTGGTSDPFFIGNAPEAL